MGRTRKTSHKDCEQPTQVWEPGVECDSRGNHSEPLFFMNNSNPPLGFLTNLTPPWSHTLTSGWRVGRASSEVTIKVATRQMGQGLSKVKWKHLHCGAFSVDGGKGHGAAQQTTRKTL